MPAEHDAWTLLAIDLQTLTRQATRSPYARLRALQVGRRRAMVFDVVGVVWQLSWLLSNSKAPYLPCLPAAVRQHARAGGLHVKRQVRLAGAPAGGCGAGACMAHGAWNGCGS